MGIVPWVNVRRPDLTLFEIAHANQTLVDRKRIVDTSRPVRVREPHTLKSIKRAVSHPECRRQMAPEHMSDGSPNDGREVIAAGASKWSGLRLVPRSDQHFHDVIAEGAEQRYVDDVDDDRLDWIYSPAFAIAFWSAAIIGMGLCWLLFSLVQ